MQVRPVSSRTLTAALTVAVLAGACAGAEAGPAAARRTAWPILVVREPDALRRSELGLRPLPLVHVAGDGRLVVRGPRVATLPAPALPGLRLRRLSRSGIDRLDELAHDAGLDRPPPDYGRPAGAGGAQVTEIVYRPPGGLTFTHRIAGLASDARLTAGQRVARLRVRRFVRRLQLPDTAFGEDDIGPDRAYPVGALEIAAARVDFVQEPLTKPLPWPVGSVELEGAPTCTAVTGADADALERALRRADAASLWRDGGADYRLVVRPVLPDETPCP